MAGPDNISQQALVLVGVPRCLVRSAAMFFTNPVPPVGCRHGREILQMWKVPKWNQDWLDGSRVNEKSNAVHFRTDHNCVLHTAVS